MAYDVSVLIPAYRASDLIARAVTSLARQGPVSVQTVICADDDTDYLAVLSGQGIDTAHMVQCRTEQEQSGPAAARNVALAHAEADIVALLDADDEFVEGRLPALIGAVGQSGAATGPTVEFRDGEVTRIARPEGRDRLTVEDICGMRMPLFPVFRKELAGGGWPPIVYAEDVVFNVGLLLRAPRYAFVEDAPYAYHLREGSLSNDANTLERAKTGYEQILAYLGKTGWPDAIEATVRRVIEEDMAMVKSAGKQHASPAGAWRDAWARTRDEKNSPGT